MTFPTGAPAPAVAFPVLEETVGRASAATFAGLSALRRRRVFHLYGVSFTGTLTVHGRQDPRFGASLLDTPAERTCIVRFSRGAGLPEPLPDILGMAVRILGPDETSSAQDLLLVTAGERPVARRMFLPSADYIAHHYSSVLPYRVGNTRQLFGSRPRSRAEARTIDELTSLVVTGQVDVVLDIATPSGPWLPVGTLRLGRSMAPSASERLRFDVANSEPDIQAAGVLNALRRRAYPASQDARLAAATGH